MNSTNRFSFSSLFSFSLFSTIASFFTGNNKKNSSDSDITDFGNCANDNGNFKTGNPPLHTKSKQMTKQNQQLQSHRHPLQTNIAPIERQNIKKYASTWRELNVDEKKEVLHINREYLVSHLSEHIRASASGNQNTAKNAENKFTPASVAACTHKIIEKHKDGLLRDVAELFVSGVEYEYPTWDLNTLCLSKIDAVLFARSVLELFEENLFGWKVALIHMWKLFLMGERLKALRSPLRCLFRSLPQLFTKIIVLIIVTWASVATIDYVTGSQLNIFFFPFYLLQKITANRLTTLFTLSLTYTQTLSERLFEFSPIIKWIYSDVIKHNVPEMAFLFFCSYGFAQKSLFVSLGICFSVFFVAVVLNVVQLLVILIWITMLCLSLYFVYGLGRVIQTSFLSAHDVIVRINRLFARNKIRLTHPTSIYVQASLNVGTQNAQNQTNVNNDENEIEEIENSDSQSEREKSDSEKNTLRSIGINPLDNPEVNEILENSKKQNGKPSISPVRQDKREQEKEKRKEPEKENVSGKGKTKAKGSPDIEQAKRDAENEAVLLVRRQFEREQKKRELKEAKKQKEQEEELKSAKKKREEEEKRIKNQKRLLEKEQKEKENKLKEEQERRLLKEKRREERIRKEQEEKERKEKEQQRIERERKEIEMRERKAREERERKEREQQKIEEEQRRKTESNTNLSKPNENENENGNLRSIDSEGRLEVKTQTGLRIVMPAKDKHKNSPNSNTLTNNSAVNEAEDESRISAKAKVIDVNYDVSHFNQKLNNNNISNIKDLPAIGSFHSKENEPFSNIQSFQAPKHLNPSMSSLSSIPVNSLSSHKSDSHFSPLSSSPMNSLGLPYSSSFPSENTLLPSLGLTSPFDSKPNNNSGLFRDVSYSSSSLLSPFDTKDQLDGSVSPLNNGHILPMSGNGFNSSSLLFNGPQSDSLYSMDYNQNPTSSTSSFLPFPFPFTFSGAFSGMNNYSGSLLSPFDNQNNTPHSLTNQKMNTNKNLGSSETFLCVICKLQPTGCVLRPCGHAITCLQCAKTLTLCPFDSIAIERIES